MQDLTRLVGPQILELPVQSLARAPAGAASSQRVFSEVDLNERQTCICLKQDEYHLLNRFAKIREARAQGSSACMIRTQCHRSPRLPSPVMTAEPAYICSFASMHGRQRFRKYLTVKCVGEGLTMKLFLLEVFRDFKGCACSFNGEFWERCKFYAA